MKEPQFIDAGRGETLVVLSLETYEGLVGGSKSSRGGKPRSKSPGAKVRADVASRLNDGASPVKVWREYRSLKSKDLAATVGISAGYLSQIESGSRTGTVKVIAAIADALDVSSDDLT
jgi:DNA-binding XRE family transcriptional regulator